MLVAAGFTVGVGLHKSLPYDLVDDLTFIAMVTRIAYVIAVRPDGPYKTIAAPVAAAKAQPGKIHYAAGGVGTGIHLTMEPFLARAGLQREHVPYRGGTTQVQALLSGDVPVLVDTPTPIVGQVEAGKIKPLAISSKARWVRWPDVPTIDETVLSGFEVAGRLGGMGPKGLPAPILARPIGESIRCFFARHADDGGFAPDSVSPHDVPDQVEPSTGQLQCRLACKESRQRGQCSQPPTARAMAPSS